MATIKFSEQPTGTPVTLNFDPTVDLFRIDTGLSAASFAISSPTANTTLFSWGGKAITLKTAISKLTSGNVTFSDHSVLRIGDNDHNGVNASADGLGND